MQKTLYNLKFLPFNWSLAVAEEQLSSFFVILRNRSVFYYELIVILRRNVFH